MAGPGASSRSGKSSRQWEPRVSSRSRAARARAVLSDSRLVVSQPSTPGASSPSAPQARRGLSRASPMPSAARSTPTRVVIMLLERRAPVPGDEAVGSRVVGDRVGPRRAARRAGPRRSGGRRRAPRAGSWRPAGWRRGRRSRRPRRWRRGRGRRSGRAGRWRRRRRRSAGPGRPGSGRSTGSTPCSRQTARIVGNRRSQKSAPRWRASSHMCGRPVSSIRRVIALATTSRGARSASSCWPCMNRSPSKSTRKAPSPRTASEISGCWPCESGPRYITVGWNWTNSRSRRRRAGPQRQRHAVAGRDARVGGLREHLARGRRCQHDRAAVDGADAVALALAEHVQGHPGDAAVVGAAAGRRPARAG